MKKLIIGFFIGILLISMFAYAGKYEAKDKAVKRTIVQGESTSVKDIKLELLRVENERKVEIKVNGVKVDLRKGSDHKYNIPNTDFSIYLITSMFNSVDPKASKATFEFMGLTENEINELEGKPKLSTFVLDQGKAAIINGMVVGLKRVKEGRAQLSIDGTDVSLAEKDVLDDGSIYLGVDTLYDNRMDETFDKVGFVVKAEPTEIRDFNAGTSKAVLKKAEKLQPVKQESKEDLAEGEVTEPGSIEEELEEPEELIEEEKGFFSKLLDWIVFWN